MTITTRRYIEIKDGNEYSVSFLKVRRENFYYYSLVDRDLLYPLDCL